MSNQSILIHNLFSAFNQIPFNLTLGLEIQSLTTKQVVMHFKMKPELIGNFLQGILHGGVISSVLDMAGGMVVMANLIDRFQDKPEKELITILSKTSTINLQVNYLRPGNGLYFLASGSLTKFGKKVAFTHMSLENDEKKLIATASGTYSLK